MPFSLCHGERKIWTLVSMHEFCTWECVVLYPCEVGADLQLRQRLADVSAQLCSGGVWLLVVTARVVEGAVDTGPNQAQVEVEFPCSFLEDLQTHTDVLQGLLGFSHGWIERERSWDWQWRGLLLWYEGKIQRCKKNAHEVKQCPKIIFTANYWKAMEALFPLRPNFVLL